MLEAKRSGELSLLILALPALVAATVTVTVFCLGKKKKGQDHDPTST